MLVAAVDRGHAVHPRHELQELTPGQFVVEIGLIRDIADQSTRRARLLDHIVGAHLDRARIGRKQAHQQFDGGRLAGSIGSQKSKHLAGLDV